MAYGVTSAGFVSKDLRTIREELRDALRTSPHWGEQVNYEGDSAVAQLLDAFAAQADAVWQGMAAIYEAFDPDSAEGVGLENLAALDGLARQEATASSGVVTFTGTPATVIPEGTTVRASGIDVLARTTDAATIPGGGSVDVAARVTEAGPIVVGAGAIDTLADSVLGVASVTNAAAFALGLEVETDGELRASRLAAQQSAGGGVDRAIAAALRGLEFVQQALVISNRLDAPDANGFPQHSLNPILYPNTADADERAAIATVLAEHAPGGVQVSGGITYDIEDADGYTDTYGFTFASAAAVHLALTLGTTSEYPGDGDAQVKAALVAEGNTHTVGEDVYPARLLFALREIPGIKTITLTLKLGSAPSGGDTSPLSVALTQIARFDEGDITVTS